MATAMQSIKKMAIVLVMSVLLLGGLAIPAGAAPRDEGVSKANDFIFGCVSAGGDPVVIMDTTGENLTVLCRYSDGSVSVCQFLPVAKDCQWVYPLKAAERSQKSPSATASR